jgi:hypothetical protein
MLGQGLAVLGRADVRVLRVQITSQAEAADHAFPGSPTFHVGGRDLFAVDAQPALACRTYTRRDGRLSPLPESEDLVTRLREALARPWDLPGWSDFRKTAAGSTSGS